MGRLPAVELTTEVGPVRADPGGRAALILGPLVLAAVVAIAISGGRRPPDTIERTVAAAITAGPAASVHVATAPTPRAVYIPWPAIPRRSPVIPWEAARTATVPQQGNRRNRFTIDDRLAADTAIALPMILDRRRPVER
jgi:hypothetical protein